MESLKDYLCACEETLNLAVLIDLTADVRRIRLLVPSVSTKAMITEGGLLANRHDGKAGEDTQFLSDRTRWVSIASIEEHVTAVGDLNTCRSCVDSSNFIKH